MVVHYRTSEEAAEATAEAIREVGGVAWTLRGDLEEADGVEGLYTQACELAGAPIDVLVNNASRFPPGRLDETTYEDLDAMVRLHAWAPAALARAMARSEVPGGVVVNVLDARIASHDPGHVAYILSKRMLADLTRVLARELAPAIRVNGVAPGAVLAPEGIEDPQAYMEAAAQATLTGRTPEPSEVAQAVAYLVEAGSVTGQVLFVDGGRHLR